MPNVPTLLYVIGYMVVMAVSSLILTIRLRRRGRRALGRSLSDRELTSLNTWMEVEDAEEKKRGFTSSTLQK